ncbi:MAG: NADP-dependent isocitrate dehydrogenase [Clostridiales Family XIII bacterium]|nr:NADP-dependent isocitrate dehydrogenase [Clostridiales Family XIII bacterium]
MSGRIKMKTPLVEMDGDEMTRVIWQWVKEILIAPYVDLKTEYYDLGLARREETGDAVTAEAAEATLKHGVAVKCATITPNAERVKEYGLSEMWKSPNGTIRAILDGTVFRAPILVKGIVPYIPTWTKPITIARHAYGDIYRNVELPAGAGSRAELVLRDSGSGAETRRTIHEFDGGGIVQGVHNTDESIASFARACFSYALDTKQDLWFAAKDTISKTYDHHFKDIFEEIFEEEYKKTFSEAGVRYSYTLIDDMVARVVRSEGGFIWACKNYDGDVMSDMVATAYGSLAMMTSVLVSPKGVFEYEAAHGTVQKHYYRYRAGEKTSTNSVATLFAWSGALRKRGELDGLLDLAAFAGKLERAAVETIENGVMTGDLYALSRTENKRQADTEDFLREAGKRLSVYAAEK